MRYRIPTRTKAQWQMRRLGRLMLKIGIPMILSMMLQAVYNIVDSAFVSAIPKVGEQGLNALTLAFPVQMLIVAISIGTGVGCNALLSKSLGQGDKEKASRTAGNGLFLALIIYIVFVIFGIFGVDIYIRSQSSNETIINMADSYLRICSTLSFGMVFFSIFENSCRRLDVHYILQLHRLPALWQI